MTPETRAARDRLAAFLDALTVRRSNTGGSGDYLIAAEQIPGDPQRELVAGDLRLVLAALDEEPPSPPDTGKLCCCGTGTDCPACLTGRCWECPDNPERERDDEPDDWQDDDD